MLDIKLKLKPGHTTERVWMEPSPLRTLFWNVTYACNFRCEICFTDAAAAMPDELTMDEAKALISKAHEAGVQDILISGGEPFLRPDLVEILVYMAGFGITARIASNGSLLNDKILARLRRETLTKSFQISLDTADPVLYAEIHGTTSEALPGVLENLRRIQDYGFHTTVSTRLTPQTLAGIPRLLDLADKEGWATVTIHCPVHTSRISGSSYSQNEDIISILNPVFDHFCLLPHHWLIETYIPWAEYHPVMKRLGKRIRLVHRGCRAGRDRLTINPTGEISPCVCLDVPPAYIGNIKHDRLQDVFRESPVCEIFRQPERYGICAGCPNLRKCGGGCRAAAFALTGRLDGEDVSCPVWKSRARDYRWK